MIKTRRSDTRVSVTFELDPRVGADAAAVCGEWNGWSADSDPMHRDRSGGFEVTVDLEAGRSYRFRYLLDGHRWENDWAADAYVPNEFGGDDSVVDLTALAEPTPPAAAKAKKKAAAGAAKRPGSQAAGEAAAGTEAAGAKKAAAKAAGAKQALPTAGAKKVAASTAKVAAKVARTKKAGGTGSA